MTDDLEQSKAQVGALLDIIEEQCSKAIESFLFEITDDDARRMAEDLIKRYQQQQWELMVYGRTTIDRTQM